MHQPQLGFEAQKLEIIDPHDLGAEGVHNLLVQDLFPQKNHFPAVLGRFGALNRIRGRTVSCGSIRLTADHGRNALGPRSPRRTIRPVTTG